MLQRSRCDSPKLKLTAVFKFCVLFFFATSKGWCLMCKYIFCQISELMYRGVQKALQISRTHHFFDLPSELVFLLHHGNYLLLHNCSHVHVHGFCLGGHVTNHLIVGEDAVTAQLSVMCHAVTANWHLREKREKKNYKGIYVYLLGCKFCF